ncbi:zinc-binding dehydrogenase [Amycolatopsis sp. NPDC026612]|uniref:zinc-binding dehydrogenase n=1 Tax=Amycolatopsis sp. NPDC026612 TaxID=3155466 RepID=UPI0033F7EDE9
MRALVHDPAAPAGLRIADTEPPVATDSQVLVEIQAVSLNFGELAYLTRQRRPGEVPGCDAAGIVVRPAADGSGASGGVGRFAVQLAAHAGAEVIASVGSTARGDGLAELGAAEVVVGLGGIIEPVFGLLDNVGGNQLTEGFGLLGDGGIALSIGQASREATTIDFERERVRGGLKRLESFVVHKPFGPDLAYLVSLLAKGRLDPQIGWRGPWDHAPEAATALLGRHIPGKAVLDIGPTTVNPQL